MYLKALGVFLIMFWLFGYGRWYFYDGTAYFDDEILITETQNVRNTVKRLYNFKFGITTDEFEALIGMVDHDLAEPYMSTGMQYTSFVEMHSGLHSIATVRSKNCVAGVILNDTLMVCSQDLYSKIQSELLDMVERKRVFRSVLSSLECQRFGGC